ncbi:MAG TPA: hypothetical protein QGH10_11315 [Armatimonadota bacterium]|nr:hypothetical protein [Armatimonadota bacterium]
MSKLKPIYVLIPGVLLVVIIVCVFLFVLLPPVKKANDQLTADLQVETDKANEHDRVAQRLEDARVNLDEQQAKLDEYIKTRGVRISTYTPVEAMIAYWYELQEDLAPTIEMYLESTGCTIIQGAALPAPTISPPTLGPASFFRIPSQGGMTFTVRGTEQELRDLYAGLSNFERVATISGLSLLPVGNGEKLDVTFTLTTYLLAEGPAAAAAAPAAGGTGMGTTMPGMDGDGPPGMGGGSGMGGGEAAAGGGDDDDDDEDEEEDEDD